MARRSKNGDASFIMQGSILAIASIVSRIVGLLYRVPLTATIGDSGNGYYAAAYEIYNIILLISSYSIPLAVSKLVSARIAKGHVKDATRVLHGALIFAFISGGLAAGVVYFGAEFFTGVILKKSLAAIALKVLAPTLLVVAILGVFRGFFQGLGTMIPSAISQIGEQIVNAIVSVVAANALFSYGKKVGGVLGDVDEYAAAFGAAGGTLGTSTGAFFALIFIL
ncbi:MAG: oligosaccharide flippase family protein, partial [Pseudobutyrivibrio sp.]|nr:oligosaccharide flippase family protein [Pseudobutyrivibrio sp.]